MDYVTLEPAFSFTCPSCGSVGYAEARLGEMSDEMMDALFDEGTVDGRIDVVPDYTDDATFEGEQIMAEAVVPRVVVGPHKVSCGKCGEAFLTRVGSDDDGVSE